MAVKRQANLLGQGRFDIPHFRSLESAICNDFDVLGGSVMSGDSPYVIKGFSIVDPSTTGVPAEDALLSVAGGLVMHPTASESGTVFSVPATQPDEVLNTVTNARVSGAFQASSANYIGIDLLRAADDTTIDTVQFLGADTNREVPKSVPLARTLDYKIYISVSDFDVNSHLLPVAIVTTDANNDIASIVDARPMLFRLGSGGNVPDTTHSYSWSDRSENVAGDIFAGGDKDITSFKSWADVIMSRLWEVGGGEHWYSPCTLRDVKMIRTGATPMTAFTWVLGTETLSWTNLEFIFTNGTSTNNTVAAGSAVLLANECLYVDIDRGSVAALTPTVAPKATVGSGLPGERFVIAWRNGNFIYTADAQWPVGTTWDPADIVNTGTVRLNQTPSTGVEGGAASSDASPSVVAIDLNGTARNSARIGNNHGFLGFGFGLGVGVKGQGAVGVATNGGNGLWGVGGVGFPGGHGTYSQGGTGTLEVMLGGNGGGGILAYAGNGGVATDGAGVGGNGGRGIVANGGQGGAGNTVGDGGPGAWFAGGDGTLGGLAIEAYGGIGITIGGTAGNFYAGAATAAGASGAFGLSAFGADGVGDPAGVSGNGGYAFYGEGGDGGSGDTAGSGDAGIKTFGGNGASSTNAGNPASNGGYGAFFTGGDGGAKGGGLNPGNGGAGAYIVGGNKGAGAGGAPIGGVGVWAVGTDGASGIYSVGDAAGHGVEASSTGAGNGVAGSSSTGVGVSGVSTVNEGIYGTGGNAPGDGVHGLGGTPALGNLEGGIGVHGVGGAGSGIGIDGIGVKGESTDGTGVRGVSTTGPGGSFEGATAIRITGGEIAYLPVVTRYVHVAPSDFVADGTDTLVWEYSGGEFYVYNSSVGATGTAFARVYLPAGSAVTAVHAIYNNTFAANNHEIGLECSMMSYDAVNFWYDKDDFVAAASQAVNNATHGEESYAVVAQVVPSNGWVSVMVTLPIKDDGGAGIIKLLGIKIEYTQPTVIPAC